MEAVAAAATALSAYSSYQQGQQQQAQYNLQAKMSTAEGERRQLQYLQRANDLARRLKTTNATLVARSAAGNIDPFSGSTDIVRAANETAFGRDYSVALADADAALRNGTIQAQIYETAGKQAARRGMFEAASKLGMAAVSQATPSKFGETIKWWETPAPIEMGKQMTEVVDRSVRYTG